MRGKTKRWMAVVLVLALGSAVPAQAAPLPPLFRVNAPYFTGPTRFAETAIFWFGRITPTGNYADVRVGYNSNEIYVHMAIFDRLLWYDPSPASGDLTAWDAVSLYLSSDGNLGEAPTANTYRLDAQLNNDEQPRTGWQAAYRGNGSGWITATVPFTTETSYWYETDTVGGVNNGLNNRGWYVIYHIPFTSLGQQSGPPLPGTLWGLGVVQHDRDDAPPAAMADKMWPTGMTPNRPATWGQLAFGMPGYTPPPTVPRASVDIRHKLNGATVVDAAVGGGFECGGDLTNYWNVWGETNYAGIGSFNVQNQWNISDWPCFSKYYVTFPLGDVPSGKVIISATLTLHHFGNPGGGPWGPPPRSYIQVLTAEQDWNESTLTWNNAPQARENIAATWVEPLSDYGGDLGVPYTWDISRAVAEAYGAGEPLRLAVYSADSEYHSGRYFWSSDHDDYPAEARPMLTVMWGDPLTAVHKTVWPITPASGHQVTYTLSLLGSGHALTLTDDLPAQVSAPGPIQLGGEGAVAYDGAAHRLTWTGAPTVGLPVTLTFPVTLVASGPMEVRNTVVLTDSTGSVSADTATLIVDARKVWLPLILRE